ncbi:MAG: hypothetical protein JST09_06810 [Bacteroidetes bacterium]|nr:hypothetical protein [Bacteroidota bacterium]
MNKKFIIFLLLIFISGFAFSQIIEKPYDYPIKRGTSEWFSIKTYDSLRIVSQIPFDIIEKMSTNVLVQSIINYPLLGDVFVFESYQKGLEKLNYNFTAIDALLQRSDLDSNLLATYTKYLDKNIDSFSVIKKGEYSVQISFIELLIQYCFQQNKIAISKNQLYLRQLLRSYYKKKISSDIFGAMSLSTCVWSMNGILLADKASEKFATQEVFIIKGNTFSDSVVARLATQAETFLKQTTSAN